MYFLTRETISVSGYLTMQVVTSALSNIITAIANDSACCNMKGLDRFELARGERQKYPRYFLMFADLLLTQFLCPLKTPTIALLKGLGRDADHVQPITLTYEVSFYYVVED